MRGNSVFQTESGETSSSALAMLSLHCPLDIQREMSSRELDGQVWGSVDQSGLEL